MHEFIFEKIRGQYVNIRLEEAASMTNIQTLESLAPIVFLRATR